MSKKTTSKIMKFARGKDCTVRIPGVCSFDPEKSVGAHRNGYGMGGKFHDFQTAICCSKCHAVLDGKVRSEFTPDELLLMHYEGIMRSQEIYFNEGLIVTKGSN